MNSRKTAFWIVKKLSAAVLTGKNSHWAAADDMTFQLPASRVFCNGGHRLRRLEQLFQQSHFVFYKLLKTNGKRRGTVLRKKLRETLFVMFRDGVPNGGLLIFLLKFGDVVFKLFQLLDKFVRFLLKSLDMRLMAFPVIFRRLPDGIGLLAAGGDLRLKPFGEIAWIHFLLRVEKERKQRKQYEAYFAHCPSPLIVTGSGRSAGGRLPELISMAWAMAGK